MPAGFRIVTAGDAMLLVEFEDRVDAAINARAIAVAARVRTAGIGGVRDVVPTLRSVAVHFDPLATRTHELMDLLAESARAIGGGDAAAEGPVIEVPVRYGGADGPDLEAVAAFAGASVDDVVARHTAAVYRVFMLGFLPGFAYMGTVDARIAAPRRASPRTLVPRGSVGIAGVQTGIYPLDTPGGWQIVGRTDLEVFDLARSNPFLFRPGDRVRFVAVPPRDGARVAPVMS